MPVKLAPAVSKVSRWIDLLDNVIFQARPLSSLPFAGVSTVTISEKIEPSLNKVD